MVRPAGNFDELSGRKITHILDKAKGLYYHVLSLSYSFDEYTTLRRVTTERDLGIDEVIHTVLATATSRLLQRSWNDK
jgi:hypothetical protein